MSKLLATRQFPKLEGHQLSAVSLQTLFWGGVGGGSIGFEPWIRIPVIVIGVLLLFSSLPDEKLRQCLEIYNGHILPHLFRLIAH
jgi:hypothetical protein